MEDGGAAEFGSFVGVVLVIIFLFASTYSCVTMAVEIVLKKEDWSCTKSEVVSGKDELPVVERCTQYSLKPTK